MNFDAFIADIRKHQWKVFGVEAYQKGQLAFQYGDTKDHRHPIYSATKTLTSIAAGMALDEGKLDLEWSVIDCLPKHFVEEMPKSQKDRYKQISFRRLMTMSVPGYPFRPEGESWIREALACPVRAEEKAFDYSNFPAYLTGAAVSHLLDEDLYAYLNRKCFKPLGIIDPPCKRCSDGYFYGASGMELTVNELSRIGLMLMQEGRYQGHQIVSEAYVREATRIQQMNREGGYGYFIWKYRDGFSINGKWKQKCYVLPRQERIVTFLSNIPERVPEFMESVEQNLLS